MDEPSKMHSKGSYGGRPLSKFERRSIVHLYYNVDLSPNEIAPLIKSPRRRGGISVQAVKKTIEFFDKHHHVDGRRRGGRSKRPMKEEHANHLVSIVKESPWLYLDEISKDLRLLCGVTYSPNYCFLELKRRGYTLKVMKQRARQRDEEKRMQYWMAIFDLMESAGAAYHPSFFVFSTKLPRMTEC